MAVQLTLVIPGLLAHSVERLAQVRSLAALEACSDAPRLEPRGIAAALLASAGVGGGAPVAPLALRGAGGDPADDYILCAEPVNLVADRDTVVLAQTIGDLSAGDSEAIVRMLDRHFEDDDVRFDARRPDAWFARRRQAPRIVTTAPDVAGGHRLIASMPGGPDAGQWKRWQNEIEMMLHEHEVNVAREARGEPIVSGVWFWGGGRLADIGAVPVAVVAGPPGRLGDTARGIAACGGGSVVEAEAEVALARMLERVAESSVRNEGSLILAMAVLPGAGNLATVESGWLAPALDLLMRRRIAALHVVADGNGAAATWIARRPPWFRRISARYSRRPLAIPSPASA